MDVIVHGGAGDPPDDPQPRQSALAAAAADGAAESTPLDAVEAAVRALEHDPNFNAGVGASVQSDGIPRTDAGVMTAEGEVGAACAMPGVEHAVTVARIVLEETPHVLVAGVHAVDLADAFGVPVEADLWADRTRERWAALDPPPEHANPPLIREQLAWVTDRWSSAGGEDDGDGPRPLDTVGAVARERNRIAAATSTGGRWSALAGRVGDVPQVGSGFFATPAAGASATGAGEAIARTTLAREAVRRVEDGADAARAAAAAIETFEASTDATAGIVVADAAGGLAGATNAEAMQTATHRR